VVAGTQNVNASSISDSLRRSAWGAAWFLLCGVSVFARETLVRDPREFAAALAAAGAGDEIVLRAGTWTDFSPVIDRGGAEGHPLIVRAEEPGKTVLNGSSSLEIVAPHVVVDGLFFHGGAIRKGSVIRFRADHGVVRETAIVDYNPAEFDTGYYWVFFDGSHNRLERCYFKGKNNLSPLIGNALSGAEHNTVVRCHFINIPYAEANGREIIRVWGAGKFDGEAAGGAYFTVAQNLFDHADGEGTEIISLKSNHNRVLENTVIATRGCLNIRQGADNLLKGNIILGQGRPGTQGLRMSGARNTVEGNLVVGCEFGIRVSAGEYIGGALTPQYAPKKKKVDGQTMESGVMATYPQVRQLTLADNVTVGISGADLEIGFSYQRRWPVEQMVLLPEDCVIRGNRFVRPQGGDSIIGTVPPSEAPFDRFRFVPNRYEGNRLVGGQNRFAPAAEGVTSEPLPHDWQEQRELAAFSPLSARDVGPAWVIALRERGAFPQENDQACYRPETPAAPKREKKGSL
jgi:poly(beta-D-mannuronate) lyase